MLVSSGVAMTQEAEVGGGEVEGSRDKTPRGGGRGAPMGIIMSSG